MGLVTGSFPSLRQLFCIKSIFSTKDQCGTDYSLNRKAAYELKSPSVWNPKGITKTSEIVATVGGSKNESQERLYGHGGPTKSNCRVASGHA